MDVKLALKPSPTLLVRVAKNGGLETEFGAMSVEAKLIEFIRGLFHTREADPYTSQVNMTRSPSHANRLPFAILDSSNTLAATVERIYISK